MAKFDEADPRWIVQERADGTNVNGWHWQEHDATAWSRRRLEELFEGRVLVEEPRVVATGVEAMSGEAFLNNRKARLVAAYELKVSVGWRGSIGAGGGAEEAKGTIELPVRPPLVLSFFLPGCCGAWCGPGFFDLLFFPPLSFHLCVHPQHHPT